MTSSKQGRGKGTVPPRHARFLPMIPGIQRQVRSLFRHLSRRERDDALAELSALVIQITNDMKPLRDPS